MTEPPVVSDKTLAPALSVRDHVVGRGDALVTLVEYGDYECPFSAMAHPVMKAVQREMGGDLRFAFRHFPLTAAHPHAALAAAAAEAAGAQGRFWHMHDVLFEHQQALDTADLVRYARSLGLDTLRFAQALDSGTYEEVVRMDFRGGLRSGVNGTPAFFVNGQRYEGVWSRKEPLVRSLRDAARGSGRERPLIIDA
jgi:protein-disulfide isomerase